MSGICVIEGPLSKWTNMMKGWQYRWFVLDDNVGLLSYYTSREKRMRGERRGCVRLQGAVIGIDDEDDSTFTITVDQKTFHFQAKHLDEKEQWINCLESVIMKVSQPRLQYFSHNLGSSLSTSMSDFDRKLAEADAYLKILIDQIQDLQRRIISFPTTEDSLREKFISLKASAEVMVESIKQTIVFLQISKHNIMHINTPNSTPQTIGQFTTPVKSCDKPTVTAALSSTFNNFTAPVEASINGMTTEVSTHRSAECLVDSYAIETQETNSLDNNHHHHHHLQPLGQANHSALSNSLPNLLTPSDDFQDVTCHETFPKVTRDANLVQDDIIPDESFSSSDDDERYYDAEDEQHREASSDKGKTPPKASAASDASAPLSSEDEDGEDDDGKMESMANHGSLLSHLLSQLHIGMDLTKVTLPTFILEKRSLLEMYSDFMSHPDLFVSIADQKTPKERFISMVRWYLSAFHAGKKSGVAKKPYNPILGECFKCYYELPQKQPLEPTDQELDKDGPIPWCSKSNLSFVAEQVSHHPPISAFYAECYKKRISINGYIWTKSKFLGLSVGVHMIGQAVISVLEYDEDYVVTFPNGYGRSILTVPWMELGGKVSITCSKTGYNANIEFLTKPFYGGKKDQVSVELFGANDKKPFATIKGEWNGTMHLKTGSNTELFLDTKAIPVIKKQVKPIDQQDQNESRRMWRSVTQNLKARNIDKATEGKCKLEQQQRDEAKARKDAGQKFETKLFHEVGAHWVFDKPLVSRVSTITPSSARPRSPLDQSVFSNQQHSNN